MRRAILILGAMASLVASSSAGKPSPPTQLNPVSPWRLDYGEERCTLAQQYGSGNDAVLLQIDSYGSWNDFKMTLAGKGVPASVSATGRTAVRFPSDAAGREGTAYFGTTAETKDPAVTFPVGFIPYELYAHLSALSAEQRRKEAQPSTIYPDFERTISAMVVAFDSGASVELHVGNLASPLAALRKCVDALNRSWGLDPAVQRDLSRQPWPTEKALAAVAASVPPNMVINGVNANMPVRVMVDAAGKATSCHLQAKPVDPDLMFAICSSLKQFTPALDNGGKPVASAFHDFIIYLLN